jgi:hypothetical protein
VEILKAMAENYLNQLSLIVNEAKNWTHVTFDELEVGDIVKSITYTHSQKWMLREGYEEFNMVKIGILISKGDNGEDSILLTEEGEMKLYANPGSSGGIYLYRYNN